MQERKGEIIIEGKAQKVIIMDNGENLDPESGNTIPNHDKVEIIYPREEEK